MKQKECKYKDHVGERLLPITEFRKKSASKDGLTPQCKTCFDAVADAWRKRNMGKRRAQMRVRNKKLYEKFRAWKTERGCLHCDETEGVCLDLHHPDPTEKEKNPSDLVGGSWKKLMEEAEKCIVVCSNCHRKLHAGLIK